MSGVSGKSLPSVKSFTSCTPILFTPYFSLVSTLYFLSGYPLLQNSLVFIKYSLFVFLDFSNLFLREQIEWLPISVSSS
ncbi:hypothetical protein K502DRAFT_37322 [Neoconidiobolus thromboides FSU 785]|nr:hypothetical protein K502DRAFT_37322 [Neoconidiobolus thromboides FSU 785]